MSNIPKLNYILNTYIHIYIYNKYVYIYFQYIYTSNIYIYIYIYTYLKSITVDFTQEKSIIFELNEKCFRTNSDKKYLSS